jgi:hypothetical protein
MRQLGNMNRTISISFKALLGLLLCILLVVLLFLLLPSVINLLEDKGDNQLNAIIGLTGNIAGGIIGGIVAYIVAAYQISKSNEQIEITSLKQSYVNLTLLLDEIEFNEKVFRAINDEKDIKIVSEHLNKHLISDQWSKIQPSFADHLSSEDFKNICKLYRNIHFIKSNTENINTDFVNQARSFGQKAILNINSKLENILQKI